jgi:glycosyltransferase involved in cell wall biosynthesis
MSEQTQAALRAIDDLHGPYDAGTHKLVHLLCNGVKATADQSGTASIGKVIERLKSGAKTSNFFKRVLLSSTLADVTGEPQWFDRLFDDASIDEMTFDIRHTLMDHLSVSLFLNRHKLPEAEHERLEQVRLRGLFMRLVEEADASLSRSSFAAAPISPVKDRVVIMTPQFLRVPHATTMRALEYARSLAEDFGRTPIIVEAHVSATTSPIAFLPAFSSHINDALLPVDRIEDGRHAFEYYRIASPYFSLQDLVAVTGLISALAPELVIAIGTPNIAAEAAALRFPTFVQPTTAAMPITVHAKSFSWRPASEAQLGVLRDAGVAQTYLFDMHPGFSAPDSAGELTRSDLGLSPDAFVLAVVGNRLDVEADASFLDLLETVVEHPRIAVAMMGSYERLPAFVDQRPKLRGRVHLVGFQEDILAALRCCDAFLNPDRTGGGRAAAYALHAGLPVLSLTRGDVAGTVGEQRCQSSYADMASRAKAMADAPAFHADLRADALARAREVIGVRPLIERILAHA